MTIHYTDDRVTLHHGDCLDVLATLPEASVDAIVTDPPYGLGFMGKAWDGLPPGREWAEACLRVLKPGGHLIAFGGTRTWHRLATAVEDAGFEVRDSIAWLYGSGFPKSFNLPGGLGTALKPAFEPIVVARKPLVGTVAATVLAHGTGALNIDACRVRMSDADQRAVNAKHAGMDVATYVRTPGVALNLSANPMPLKPATAHEGGRWPANVVLDEDMAAELDEQSGDDDQGGASRFFYTAKADSNERPRVDGIAHPTVKPLSLMRWLVRLVTPPGGVVLEPFAGSGTTVEACLLERFRCVAIEREADYLPLILARIHRRLDPLAAIRLAGDDLGLFEEPA